MLGSFARSTTAKGPGSSLSVPGPKAGSLVSQRLRLITSQNNVVWLLLAAWTNTIDSCEPTNALFSNSKADKRSLLAAQVPTLWSLEPAIWAMQMHIKHET